MWELVSEKNLASPKSETCKGKLGEDVAETNGCSSNSILRETYLGDNSVNYLYLCLKLKVKKNVSCFYIAVDNSRAACHSYQNLISSIKLMLPRLSIGVKTFSVVEELYLNRKTYNPREGMPVLLPIQLRS